MLNKTPLILDSTLREGEQTPGVCFKLEDKIKIATLLDEIGIDIIEVGHPAVNKEIYQAVKKISNLGLKAKIAAHSRSIQSDIDLALDCNVDFIGIFYCVSNQRLNGIFKKTPEQAAQLVSETIKYAKSKKNDLIVRYTPEDTVRSDFENVVKVSYAAVKAGADMISIADTTGYMLPLYMFNYVKKLKSRFLQLGINPQIEVHCHNDLGFSLANSISAYNAGVNIIDASVLGLGERAGITDLCQLVSTLFLKYDIKKYELEKLFELYNIVSNASGIEIPVNLPLMGKYAFTHCAGLHTQAYRENPAHYQSVDPQIFNRQGEVALDHMSGIPSVRYRLEKLGLDYLSGKDAEILKIVKQEGKNGLISDKRLKEIYEELKIGC